MKYVSCLEYTIQFRCLSTCTGVYLIRCIIHMHALSRQFVYEPLQIRFDVRIYLVIYCIKEYIAFFKIFLFLSLSINKYTVQFFRKVLTVHGGSFYFENFKGKSSSGFFWGAGGCFLLTRFCRISTSETF